VSVAQARSARSSIGADIPEIVIPGRVSAKHRAVRNHLARLMFMADTIERKSYAVRAKGKHGGALGRSALPASLPVPADSSI
jgi:hypothetical protein